jgi:hypothetical protein
MASLSPDPKLDSSSRIIRSLTDVGELLAMSWQYMLVRLGIPER